MKILEVKNGKIERMVSPNKGYGNHISFGINATEQDYKDAGLYILNEAKPELTESQYYGEYTDTINDETQTVERVYSILNQDIADLIYTKKTKIVEKSNEILNGGITVTGMGTIATDERARNMLTGAWAEGVSKPNAVFDFPLPDFKWATVTKVELDAIRDMVGQHVRDTYANERLHIEAVDALTDAGSIMNYDFNTGW